MITSAVITDKYPLPSALIKSLAFTDEILAVVDSDKQPEKTKNGVRYLFRPLGGDFASQRNFILKESKSKWVLFVDDDEYVSKELASEITSTLSNTKKNGFYLPRVDVVYHQALSHGETGKIKILRLAKKDSGEFIRQVHERWQIKGEVGELGSPIYHIKDHFISEFVGRMQKYSAIDAQQLNEEHKYFSYSRLLLNPLGKFVQNYIFRLGLMDGHSGLFLAYLMSVQSLTVRIFQWERKK